MEQLQTIKVALLGFGTVGGGVFELLEKRKEEMPDKIGVEVRNRTRSFYGFLE